jgi:hypothetical protein
MGVMATHCRRAPTPWHVFLPASGLVLLAWLLLLTLHGTRRGWTAFLAGAMTALVGVLLWGLLMG